jgi:hypothetical protein
MAGVTRSQRVAKIASIIDELKPRGWASKIPAHFNLDDPYNCICYHVFGDWLDGIDKIEAVLGKYPTGVLSDDPKYHDLWVDEINERRGKRKLPHRS